MAYKESYAGRINRKLNKKLHVVEVAAGRQKADRGAKGLLKKVELFDIYRGIGVAPGSKSVAFSLTLRADDRSLTGEEADEDVKSILALLEAELGAKLR